MLKSTNMTGCKMIEQVMILAATLPMFNQFKLAGIYASDRFRGAFVGKVCINWILIDRFPSFLHKNSQ